MKTTDKSSSNSLQLSGVHKSFGRVDVLRGIDLTIGEGERVALMGPSGSGKSTLLNCICGIEGVDRGKVVVGKQNLSDLDPRDLEKVRREQVGYVFQSFHLLPTLSAFENVEFSAQLAGMGKKERSSRVQELMERVGMSHRLYHFPDTLSGGERQRVAIARALIHQPNLVLADEPTGSLDTETGAQVLDLLMNLSDEYKVSILLVTHDQESTRICDRVITMQDGILVS